MASYRPQEAGSGGSATKADKTAGVGEATATVVVFLVDLQVAKFVLIVSGIIDKGKKASPG